MFGVAASARVGLEEEFPFGQSARRRGLAATTRALDDQRGQQPQEPFRLSVDHPVAILEVLWQDAHIGPLSAARRALWADFDAGMAVSLFEELQHY